MNIYLDIKKIYYGKFGVLQLPRIKHLDIGMSLE